MRKKSSLIVLIFIMFSISSVWADAIYNDNCSSLSGQNWFENSDATNEAGDSTGGCRSTDGIQFQLNSWWDSAGWTEIWKNLSHTIIADRDYTLTVSMESYTDPTSKAVDIEFQNVTDAWSTIAANTVYPSLDGYEDYSVSFTTTGGQNSELVGDTLGIAINPGWWNNVGITDIIVTEVDPSIPIPDKSYDIDLTTTYQTFQGFGVGTVFYQGHLASGVPSSQRQGTYDKLFLDVPHEYIMFWFRPNEDTNDNSDPWDVNLGNFTFGSSQTNYITVLSEALQRKTDTKIVAVVYTPPAWLKTNGTVYGDGTLDTGVANAYEEFGEFVFANLLWYKQQGITIEGLALMNEPDWTHTHEGATYTTAQARDVHKYTVPHIQALINSGENTAGVLMPKIMMPNTLSVSGANNYINTFKSDGTAWNNTDWVANHQYGGASMSNFLSVAGNTDGKFYVMSEWHSANNSDIDPPAIEMIEQSSAIIDALRGNVNSYWWFESAHPGNTIAGLCRVDWGASVEFGKTYESWRQWSNMTPVGGIQIHVNESGGSTQLSYVGFNDSAEDAVTLHVLNEGTSSQHVGLSVADESVLLLQHYHTTETENFVLVDQFVPSNPSGETVVLVEGQSLNSFRLYHQPQIWPAPDAPDNLGYIIDRSSNEAEIQLDWNDSTHPNFNTYNVYHSTTSGTGYAAIASGLTESEYIHQNAPNGIENYYVVTALDFFSNESGYSSENTVLYLRGDFAINGIVDLMDFSVVGSGWQTSYDMNALSALSADWLNGIAVDYTRRWPFSEGTGLTTQETVSQTDNLLVNMGPSNWITGPNGGALDFSGSDDYVDIPDIDLSSEWTLAFWTKGNVSSPFGSIVLGNRFDTSSYFYMYDQLYARFCNAVGAYVNWSNDVFFYNQWRHVILIGRNDTVELFLDGVSQGSQQIDATMKLYTLGAGHSNTQYNYNGALDEVRVYDRALTIGEIFYLYP